MAESIEPKAKLGSRVLSAGLRVLLTCIVVAGGYYLAFGGKPEKTISSGELRRVVNEFREKRKERMAAEVEQMREYREAMRRIRNRRRRQARVEGELDSVLTEAERKKRARASRPLEDLAFHEVYDTARAVEQDMITLYREFLAARLMALGRGLTYPEAYEQSTAPRPSRPDLNERNLYRQITTTEEGGGLEAFRQEIRKSVVEVREMQENAEKLLAFTRKSDAQPDAGLSADLGAADAAMLAYRGPELLPDEMDFTYEPDIGNFQAMPGRRLTTDGRTDVWLYVDTWYIIGPFPGDRRRENLDVRFGPEANVNLDDVFTGKDDRKIRWEFTKVGWARSDGQKTAHWKIEPRVVETYVIYYAFTEIYCDAPRKIWIATATDDYGKLWINDELVWKSPKTRKPYNATENIQQVELQQGQNKILYRVENAGGTMGFSLMVRLATGQ